ncbi:MAG TPA: hypothetical protein P5531_10720 [Bacteroidales bacterium]|nr:hypothetical protein [Bacteroidales bacterium]HSA43565.1 hypothetical protein [Bacteroidales bacterium]
MNLRNVQEEVKFPENLEVRKALARGDAGKLAKKTGYSRAYMYEILAGRRRMQDKLLKAVISLFQERKALKEQVLSEITNQHN